MNKEFLIAEQNRIDKKGISKRKSEEKITINGCFYAKFLRKSQKSIIFAVANCFIRGYLVLTAGRTGM